MIKLIATDMDGTWLNAKKEYDHQLFLKEFKIMQERNIKFVVASGNQYDNLLTRFPKTRDSLYYVAENGALVAHGKQILNTKDLSIDVIKQIRVIQKAYDYPVVWTGLQAAYIYNSASAEIKQEAKKFFKKVIFINHFSDINDRLFKMSFMLSTTNAGELAAQLKNKYKNVGIVVGSESSIDISQLGMSKAVGLKYLSQKLGIKSKEMIAFGDSGNDVEMLKYVGYSYVTSTALPVAKRAANEIIGSSEDSSVQKKILALLTD